MRKNLGNTLIVAMLTLALTACGKAGTPTALAAGETAAALGGGGGGGRVDGQIAEGLVVVGTGTASVEPEVALVSFGIELRGDDPAALVDEGARKIDEAIAAAKGLGVSDEDIQTTGYSLWVETLYDPTGSTPTGEVAYHLSHSIQMTLRDLGKVGELLAAVAEAGANTISGVSFTVQDPKVLVEQARQLALEDVTARARQMAEGLGIELGQPILVTENGGFGMLEGIGGGGGMIAAPSISPGAFSVSISVQVVYAIR